MTKPPSKLGRGLSALMEEITPPTPKTPKKTPAKKPAATTGGRGVNTVPIDKLERNPEQPRRYFDKKLLEELTRSIKDKGVLQPILVRPLPKSTAANGKKIAGRYQIVAGERRWQAAVNAGLDNMPVLIRELSDREVLEIGVVENVQRADLNPIEEAMAYQALKDQFGRTQNDIATAIGKSRPHVANCLRLLNLPERAREYLAQGKITAGHARAILAAPDPQALADMIVDKGMSVREAENGARQMSKALRKPAPGQQNRDANIAFIEKQLAEHLGLKISINHKNPGGTMSIKYKTLEELEGLIGALRKS